MKSFAGYGEVLWDLLPGGAKLGGAVLNYACRIAGLGGDSSLISRLGEDESGVKAREQMLSLGLNCDFVQTDTKYPTGTVNVTFNETGEPDYFIVPNVAYDFILSDSSMLEMAVDSDCFCFGTLIQRREISRGTLREILENRQGKNNLLDLNLRKECYSHAIILASLKAASILKLNESEASYLNYLFRFGATNLEEFGSDIIHTVGLDYCLITLGGKGVYAKSSEGEQTYLPGFKVQVGDLIGAGDAFTAGFAYQLVEGKSLSECCEFGNRLGAIVATQFGGTTPVTMTQAAEFPFDTYQRSEVASMDLAPYSKE